MPVLLVVIIVLIGLGVDARVAGISSRLNLMLGSSISSYQGNNTFLIMRKRIID